jgi:hypothetical protein
MDRLLFGFTLITVLGWTFLCMLGVVLVVVTAFAVNLRVTAHNDRRRQDGASDERRRIAGDAWWFSEDVPTMNLIHRLSRSRDTDGVRRMWREEREASARGESVPTAADTASQVDR